MVLIELCSLKILLLEGDDCMLTSRSAARLPGNDAQKGGHAALLSQVDCDIQDEL